MQSILALIAAVLAATCFGRAHAMVVWGDLHAHSGLSDDGSGDPRDLLREARDVFGLDFIVVSDHDIHLTPEELATMNAVVAEFDEPGRFVAFPGVEWSHAWHMNFYFRDGDIEICGGGGGPACDGADDARTFYESRVLAGEAASHVNHPHPLSPVQWGKMQDDVATNVEVYNTHWNRRFGPDTNDLWFGGPLWALRVGFRLGFVGVSDEHTLGDFFNHVGTGLTACDVEELSRSAIIDALRNRRCYASTGRRALLEFHAAGTPMGGEVAAPIGSTITAEVAVTAQTIPTRIELVLNGAPIAQKTDCASSVCSLAAPIAVGQEFNFVYAKVHEGRADRTWSSPVWVRGICNAPGDCPSERLVPGTGGAASRCLASWRVMPAADRNSSGSARRRATCVTGDPSCDFDLSPSTCTFLVSLCIGVDLEQSPSCAFAPPRAFRLSTIGSEDTPHDVRNDRTLTAAAQAVLTLEAPGRCGPYVPVTVPLRQAASGILRRDARTFTLRSEVADRRDRDRLTLVCKPPGP